MGQLVTGKTLQASRAVCDGQQKAHSYRLVAGKWGGYWETGRNVGKAGESFVPRAQPLTGGRTLPLTRTRLFATISAWLMLRMAGMGALIRCPCVCQVVLPA